MASHEIESLDPAASVEKLDQTPSRAVNRRRFIAALGATGAGAALVANAINNPRAVQAAPYGPQQVDYLNFLLNFEFLQATLYSYVTTGVDLPTSLTQGSGALTNPPAKLTFPTQQLTDMFNEMYYGDLNHVKSLLGLLGSPTAIGRPAINLGAYATINVNNVLGFARMFEDVTVTAYNGVLPFLTGSNLTLASQILAAQSEHAAMLRLACIQNPSIGGYVPTVSGGVFFTGSTTTGSKVISGVYYGATVPTLGQTVTGPGIPGASAITAIGVAKNAAITGTIASASPTITSVSSVAGLAAGQLITGTGIPAGATIKTVGTNTLTLSANATASTAALAITVGSGSITVSANAIGTTANTPYSVSGADSFDIPPVDPGSASASAAGPTASGGFFNTAGGTNGTGTNPSGMAFARNTSQVLVVFYSAPSTNTPAINGTAKGGFFVNGVSGIINTI